MCRVFISHSEEDKDFVEHLRRLLYLIDIECLIAEYEPKAGTELWEKIQRMIEDSYYVIFLLTINGVKSEWVRREVTIAKTLKKKFVPVVDKLVKEAVPEPIKEKEFIPFDKENVLDTLEKIVFQMRDYKKNDIGFATNC
jgi:hypothetical protein